MSTLELSLVEGNKVFVEVEDGESDRREEVADGGILQAQFSKISDSIAQIVSSVNAGIGTLPDRPGTVEVEFGVQLKGEADFWIVTGEAQGHIKVKLKWG